MKMLLSIAVVLAGSAVLAATAHADPSDAQFVQNIRNGMGVEVDDVPGLIDSAHGICNEMKGGMPYDNVLSSFRQGNPYLDRDQAAYFISASTQAYCPEFVVQ
ncbi:MAG: DUF732 domain-containing protein [Mycobacterium sp.]|uniref:DUF732 domain-containing protein n=1 Tax=Mycobacterium sp. TaxID=1785 RepID=UPI001EC60A46|nr:DUF732 domain-containing protein [Mycobacterium sp.]MBW0020143.1 DUF732 domain-containing protein [Mycobacterium sp.]